MVWLLVSGCWRLSVRLGHRRAGQGRPPARRARAKALRRTARSKHSSWVQMRTPTRCGARRDRARRPGGHRRPSRRHPQQLAFRGPLPTSHAGPDRSREGRWVRACGRVCSRATAATYRIRRPARTGRAPAAAQPSAGSAASSERMSMRQPVRRAARRAFWPSLPIASDSWKSGTTTRAERRREVDDLDRADPGRRQRVGDQLGRVLGPVDDVDLLAVQLRHHVAHPLAHRADAGALGVDARGRWTSPRSWCGGRPRGRSRRSRRCRRRSRGPRGRRAS